MDSNYIIASVGRPDLIHALTQAYRAALKKQGPYDQPFKSTVHFRANDATSKLTIEATDGFRAYRKTIPAAFVTGVGFMVKASYLRDLLKAFALEKCAGDVMLYMKGDVQAVMFECGDYTSPMLPLSTEGTYPNISMIHPGGPRNTVTEPGKFVRVELDVPEMMEALKLAKLKRISTIVINREQGLPVDGAWRATVTWFADEGKALSSNGYAPEGERHVHLWGNTRGDFNRIAFDPRYLYDALRDVTDKTVTLYFKEQRNSLGNTITGPVVIGDWLVMSMYADVKRFAPRKEVREQTTATD